MSRIAGSSRRSCQWVQRRLAGLAAGDLSAPEQEACRGHLERCGVCSEEFLRVQAALTALRSVGEVMPPPGAMERLLWHVDALPVHGRAWAWRGWISWSAAAATVLAGVMVMLVLWRGGATRAVGGPGGATAVVAPAEGPAPSSEKSAAAAAETGARKLSGGRPSKRPGAILQAAGPSPAREAAPLSPRPSKAPRPAPRSRPAPPPELAVLPRAAERQHEARGAPEAEEALAKASGLSDSAAMAMERQAPVPTLAEPGLAGASQGPGGQGGGAGVYGEAAAKAAVPGARHRTLAAPAATGGLAEPTVSVVTEPFWHLRVEAPARLVVGVPAEFGLTIEGRESLFAVVAGVQDSEGRPLGREVQLPVVEKGRRVQASLPATMQKAGLQEVAAVLEAEQPPVKTRVTMMVEVQPAAPPEAPMVSLVLRDVPLREAAAAVARRGRITVEVDEALANLTVDCNFADPIPVETALELLVDQVGGRLEKRPDGTYHIGAGG